MIFIHLSWLFHCQFVIIVTIYVHFPDRSHIYIVISDKVDVVSYPKINLSGSNFSVAPSSNTDGNIRITSRSRPTAFKTPYIEDLPKGIILFGYCIYLYIYPS